VFDLGVWCGLLSTSFVLLGSTLPFTVSIYFTWWLKSYCFFSRFLDVLYNFRIRRMLRLWRTGQETRLRLSIRTGNFYSPTRLSLRTMLPVLHVFQETSTIHPQWNRHPVAHLKLERQSVSLFCCGLIEISKISCNISLWCLTMVANITEIMMCYEERVRSMPIVHYHDFLRLLWTSLG